MSEVPSPKDCFVTEPVILDRPAADFSADAYYRGDRVRIRLFDLLGEWVVLFFYAANFTFV
jgi:peroxiredoxin (alkyl hydroperoxide reductase subunit C)